jgi:hypothetical protein
VKLIHGGLRAGGVRVVMAMSLLVIGGALALRTDVMSHPHSASANRASEHTVAPPTLEQVRADYGRLPLIFEANQGQSDPQVKFLAHGSGYRLFLTGKDAVIALNGARKGAKQTAAVLRMSPVGANDQIQVNGAAPLPGKSNYLIGNDPTRWQRNVPQYARVRYEQVYPGIDLDYYGRQGQLEYDFEVAPGSDPKQIALQMQGAKSARLDASGNVVLAVDGGDVRLLAPKVYQEVRNEQRPVAARFVLRNAKQVGFEIGAYDRSRELVIDPVLSYSTYLGGTGAESCSAILALSAPPQGCPSITVDNGFNVYVAGATTSADFPIVSGSTTVGAFQTSLSGSVDTFIAKLDPTGTTILTSTYLGGTGTDYPAGIAVDGGFNIYVAGTTTSADFPTSGTQSPFEATPRSAGTHAYVSEVTSDGTALVYSTYLSGNGTDTATGLALDLRAKVYVLGTTTSTDQPTGTTAFPATMSSFQTVSKATTQFFLSQLDFTKAGFSSLLYSTYIGGANPTSGVAMGGGVATDTNSNIYVTGGTSFTDMPALNAFKGTNSGGIDVWVARFSPQSSGPTLLLNYLTYIGGTGDDIGTGIASDSGGDAYVTGSTTSTDFPLSTSFTALQAANAGGTDAFLVKLGPLCTGSTCTSTTVPYNYFTYLGGTGTDIGTAVAVDTSQGAHITGSTTSTDVVIPNPSPIQPNNGGGTDAFLARIDTTSGGSSATLDNFTYLGGSGTDIGTGIVLDSRADTYVTGETASGDFPTLNPFQGALSGPSDAFVTKTGPTIGLTMTAAASPDPGGVGNQITFTYTITNGGDQTTGVTFTDFVSGGATFVSAAVATTTGGCGGLVGSTVTCSLGTLNSNQVSTVTIKLTPTVAGTLGNSAQLSVPGSTVTASAGTSAAVTDFSVAVGPPSTTVVAGVPASYTVTVAPSGGTSYPNSISLSCSSGLPTGATCTVTNGSTISNLTSGAQSRQIVINTTARTTTAKLFDSSWPLYAMFFPVGGLALIGAGMSSSHKRRLWTVLLLAGVFSLITFQAACGSSGSTTTTTTGTPAGTYTLNITGTSGSTSHSSPVTLVVQ